MDQQNIVEKLFAAALRHHQAGRLAEAEGSYRRSLVIKPDLAEVHLNLGSIFRDQGRLEEAVREQRRSLALKPRSAEAYVNLGNALTNQGVLKEAIACFEAALSLNSDLAEAHRNLGQALLLSGRLAEGWQEHEWRKRKEILPADFTQPQWTGQDLSGCTILLHAEQGLGDALQFCRYLPLVAERARVVLEIQPALRKLLSPSTESITVVSAGDLLPDFDFHCPLMSLPLACGTTLETIPPPLAGLLVDPDRVAHWRERLPKTGLRIGISWQGNPSYRSDRERSLPLAIFAPLARLPGIHLVSLQKKHGLDQLADLPADMIVQNLGPDFDEGPDAFLDTVAVMMNLDLVITIDSVITHLAGSLGRPVWLVLQAVPDWRWMLDRDDSPWYPGLRLFRQVVAGDWPAVMERVARELGKVSDPFGMAFRHHQSGRFDAAESLYRRALVLDAGHADSLHLLGVLAYQTAHHDRAFEMITKAIRLNSRIAAFHSNLGNVFEARDRPDEAAICQRRALVLMPDHADGHTNLGNLLSAMGRQGDALLLYRHALFLKPDHADAHYNQGLALQRQGRLDAALHAYRHAIGLSPGRASAYRNLSTLLGGFGRFGEALSVIGRALLIKPRQGNYHHSLAEIWRFGSDDPRIGAMELLLSEPATLTDDDRIYLHFALGKAFDDIGQYEQAMAHFLSGNDLHRRRIRYDETRALGRLDQIRMAFTRDFMANRRFPANSSKVPIFVLGMPRSGTSLIEQILASHPKIVGAGELMDFSNAVHRLSADFPEGFTALNDEDLMAIAAEYFARLRERVPDAAHITDKMPNNFRFVGLIHMILPAAKIIHVRRDKVDTCLSCFTKIFTGEQPFSYDLAELGRYWRGYDRLMAHWRETLPEGAFLDVDYEDVVADLEGQARRIIAYCGLEWDPACLFFHKTERPVLTASGSQVRQPIYQKSVGRWQGYVTFLQPLTSVLEE